MKNSDSFCFGKRLMSLALGVTLALGTFAFALSPVLAGDADETTDTAETQSTGLSAPSYDEYLAVHGAVTEANTPDAEIVIDASKFASEDGSGAYVTSYAGENTCLYWAENQGKVTWEFTVYHEGYYQLGLDYCAIANKNTNIIMDIYLDGEIPFKGAANVNINRLYLDETYVGYGDNVFETNNAGDELRPSLVEQFDWQTSYLADSQNEYPEGLWYYLTEGKHTLTVALVEESIAIHCLFFSNPEGTISYEDYLAAVSARDSSGQLVTIEAEKAYLKNDVTLFATYDTGYVHVTPSSSKNTLYNTIGKNTWKEYGQTITWEFEVPEDGYYYLAFKYKQNSKSNAYSVRSYTIDGKTLYTEMGVQKYAYYSSWKVQTLCNAEGESLKVYLTKGYHILGSTATIDTELAEVLREVSDIADGLQDWYRQIIKITGFNADSSRITVDLNNDFKLDEKIPGLMDAFEEYRVKLLETFDRIDDIDGMSSSSASILKETATLLEYMIKHPGKIANRLETFLSDINTMATWAIDMKEQPLQLDKIFVYSPDVKTPGVGGGFFQQIWYRFQLLINSFMSSTTTISGTGTAAEGSATIRVWISTSDITTTGASSGRDQAIILKKLIDENFTAKTGINVDVSLIGSSDTLVQAVLAGEGPDAALFANIGTPVNLAMRGMLLDLSQFEGYEDVLTEFTESAYSPFWYKGKLYAFPETMSYNMIFYRTDIYEDLGLTPPTTWDEFYDQIVTLSNSNYMVGVPQNQNTFETFLYQLGSTFYTEDLTKSTFDQPEALEAFKSWTDLYTKYSLSLTFDFFNRFRSGEMAMGIMPFNQVNYLYSAAPELDGRWAMAPMPGTVDENGNINITETATSTGCIGLADTSNPEETYEFLRWWVSADTQSDFGTQLEQSLGIAARYGTANIVAFENIPWSSEQAAVLKTQRDATVGIEQIPGNYYISRNLSFAFRAVVYNKANCRETLNKYNIEINKELARKQEEFNY